jgi:hypothetical protein
MAEANGSFEGKGLNGVESRNSSIFQAGANVVDEQ